MKCNKCNDTGTIETGNNDLPCDCEAGDKAMFNSFGRHHPITGAELRQDLGWPQPVRPTKPKPKVMN